MKTLARNTDPESSHLAAEYMDASGKRSTNQKTILEYIGRNHGMTAAEIGAGTGLGQHEASRRLSEMAGRDVMRGGIRKCSIKGTKMLTWWPL